MTGRCLSAAAAAALFLAPLAAAGEPGEIQQPKGNWQQPGEIQQPKGNWQVPGAIQVPKGIQAVKVEKAKCEEKLVVGADALFAFDKADLSPDAEETLAALGPLIEKAKPRSAIIEGHTDSVGSDDYNQKLSERRAESVRAWLVAHGYLAASTPIAGHGEKRPVAPNEKPDHSDDAAGRQKNRRVEVVLRTCG